MEATYSEAVFVLKVNKNCQACRVRMMVALGSICGVYDIDYNAEEGVARVRAVVDPNLLMKALAGSGPHAECIGFKLRHPRMNSSYSYNDSYYHRNGYNHGYINGPFNSPHYQPYYHGSDLPPPRYSSTECYAGRRPRPFHF